MQQMLTTGEPRWGYLGIHCANIMTFLKVLFIVLCLGSLVAQTVKRLPAVHETWVRSLVREDPLEKEMATHSSVLAWETPWTEEPSRLQSMGSQRVGHDWATSRYVWNFFLGLRFSKIKKIGGKNLLQGRGASGSLNNYSSLFILWFKEVISPERSPNFSNVPAVRCSQWQVGRNCWLPGKFLKKKTENWQVFFLPYFPSSCFLHGHEGWSCSSHLRPWSGLESGIQVLRIIE